MNDIKAWPTNSLIGNVTSCLVAVVAAVAVHQSLALSGGQCGSSRINPNQRNASQGWALDFFIHSQASVGLEVPSSSVESIQKLFFWVNNVKLSGACVEKLCGSKHIFFYYYNVPIFIIAILLNRTIYL